MGDSDGRLKLERRIQYDFLPSQKKFHYSGTRFKGFSGPIGSGKSQALCHEALRLAYDNPNCYGLIGAPTLAMLRDAPQRCLLEILNRDRIPYEFNKSENTIRLTDVNSLILFRSLDDFERLRGTNLAWFGVDELTYCPEDAWLRLEGRLRDPKAERQCGFAVWTPKGFDWVYRRFVEKTNDDYEVVYAKAYENRYILDKTPDFYEKLRASYGQGLFEQEILGEYLHVNSGRVYASFERERNVGTFQRDMNWPLVWALDFNVDPMASVVAQVFRDRTVVLDEIVLSRASTQDACEEFYTRFSINSMTQLTIYGDASANHLQTAGRTDKQIIETFFRKQGAREANVLIPKSNPLVRDRVNLVNMALRCEPDEHGLYIDSRCKELIRDFQEVVYQPDTTALDKAKDPKRTHLSDALGYLLWQEKSTNTTTGLQSNRLL